MPLFSEHGDRRNRNRHPVVQWRRQFASESRQAAYAAGNGGGDGG
jgi:hypothetical protein